MKLLYTLIILSAFSFAEEKTFIREYTYQASDYDSKVTSRDYSLVQVKRILLEEVSVFMKSELDWTQTEELIEGDYEFTDIYENNIQTITAGVTKTIIIDENWTGREYWIKAKITINLNDIKSQVNAIIKDKERVNELNDLKEKTDDALDEIERLKEELRKTKIDSEKIKLFEEYKIQSNNLAISELLDIANKNFDDKKYHKAIDIYLEVLENSPKNYYALSNLGRCYRRIGLIDDAISILKKCIEIYPTQHSPYLTIAFCFWKKDRLDSAIYNFRKSIELNNYSWSSKYFAYNQLSEIYRRSGEYNKSIDCHKSQLELKLPTKHKANTHYRMGLIYEEMNQNDEAINHYYKASELGNESAKEKIKLKSQTTKNKTNDRPSTYYGTFIVALMMFMAFFVIT